MKYFKTAGVTLLSLPHTQEENGGGKEMINIVFGTKNDKIAEFYEPIFYTRFLFEGMMHLTKKFLAFSAKHFIGRSLAP